MVTIALLIHIICLSLSSTVSMLRQEVCLRQGKGRLFIYPDTALIMDLLDELICLCASYR